MARKKNTGKSKTYSSDDASDVSSEQLLRTLQKPVKKPQPIVLAPLKPFKTLTQFEDNRVWNPTPKRARPAEAVQRSDRRLVIPPTKPKKLGQRTALSPSVRFAVPEKVVLCVRRKARREALFALNRTGRGAKKHHRRRTQWTGVHCK